MVKSCNNFYPFNKNKFNLLIFFLLINTILTAGNNEITLKVQGGGEINYLNNGFNKDPSEVLVNGEPRSECKKKCTLGSGINTVVIKFSSQLTSCKEMFKGLNKIKEIDLSKFDASKVATMENMFQSCTNLKIITFGNMATSSVTNMMKMFNGCTNLKFLDLPNFITAPTTVIKNMFDGCSSLVYLSLNKFKINNTTQLTEIFKQTPSDIKICVNDANSKSILEEKTGKSINCSDTCFTNNNYKLDVAGKQCLEHCSEGTDKFEYNNEKICYSSCPSGTYPIENEYDCLTGEQEGYYFDSSKYKQCYITCKYCNGTGTSTNHNCYECNNNYPNKLIMDSSINCFSTCPEEHSKLIPDRKECINNCEDDDTHKYELNNNCYISCPSGSYPKEEYEFLCLDSKPEGYYLNSTVYKKCYEKCKNCNGYGNEDNHNCYQCSSDYPYALAKSGSEDCYTACPDGTYPKEGEYDCLTGHQEGYYLDLDSKMYKRCYLSCKNCNGYGDSTNNNCNECTSSYSFEYHFPGYINCLSSCPYFYYKDKSTYRKICLESPNCPLNYKKYIPADDQCIKKCEEDDTYKFEFENTCYNPCPNGKYPKENEYLCLSEQPDGYYFSSSVYKSCYISCKSCNRAGDSNNNNCIECNIGYPYVVIKGDFRNCYIKCPYYFYHDKNLNIKICTENPECPTEYSKLIYITNECIHECKDDGTYKYELNNQCYDVCPGGTYPKEDDHLCLTEKPEGYYFDSTVYKKCYYTCKNCNGYGDSNNHNCIECKGDYPYSFNTVYSKKCYRNSCPSGSFSKENEYLCFTEKPEGYYLYYSIYKKCYESCKNCDLDGNWDYHNCNECKVNYPYILNKNENKNCYSTCPHYYYIDKNTNMKYCTENTECPYNYHKLIASRKECVNKCEEDKEYKYELNNECYNICPVETYPKENEYICFSGTPEGYYLDSDIYKKCYVTCKNCYGPGNLDNHNCTECHSDYPYGIDKTNYINCYNNCPFLFYFDSYNNKYCTESHTCPSDYNKLISERSQCVNSCEYDGTYKFELNNKCYSSCPSGTYSIENQFICLTEKPENYYLDTTIYKICYNSCKSCKGAGNGDNHNCSECKDDYSLELIKEGYKNCYQNCPHYYYKDKINNINYCTESLACPSDYSKLISQRRECVNNCEEDETYKYEFENECHISCPSGSYPLENGFLCLNEKPQGYYLDSTIYKKCYESCKNCNGYGDSNNNNCNECKSDYPLELIRVGYKNCYDTCHHYFYYDEQRNISYCTENTVCPSNYNKLIADKKQCVNKCEGDNEHKYEFENKCHRTCPSGSYPKENEFNCLKERPEGYHLYSAIYRKCFDRCKNCYGFGNEQFNNCIECKSNYKLPDGTKYPFLYELDISNSKNCYITCPYYFYYNSTSNTHYCTEKTTCPQSYNKLILERNECVNKCEEDDIYKYEFRKRCYEQCPENSTQINDNDDKSMNKYICKPICPEETPFEYILTQECVKNCPIKDLLLNKCILNIQEDNKNERVKIIDILLQNFEKGITSTEYNTTNIEKGEDDIYEEEEMRVLITTTKNQKKKNNNNTLMIDLIECENLLRQKNKISENELLYIKMVDINEEGMEIPKMEFNLYTKSSTLNNLKRLDLSLCENAKFFFYFNFNSTENIDVYNSSSGYYNDVCYKALSENGADKTLTDRRKEFRNICPGECFFSEYDNNNKKAKCTCDIKKSVLSFKDLENNETQLYNYFIEVKNTANLKLMKCFKELFNKDGIMINIAFFIIFPFQIFHIIAIIMFFKSQKKKIITQIKDIEFAIRNLDLVKEKEKEMRGKTKSLKNKKINNIISMKSKGNKTVKNEGKTIKLMNTKEQKNEDISNEILNKPNPIKKTKQIIANNLIKTVANKTSKRAILKNNDKKPDIFQIIRVKKIMDYNDSEKNDLSYDLALKNDKRTFCQYYISLLKTKHILFFIFNNTKDYNLRIIKIGLFLISFTLYYVINALFFNEHVIHKIHEDGGSYNIMYQLPKIIYSSIISIILTFFLKLSFLSEDNILEYKNDKNINELNERTMKLENKIIYKCIYYLCFSFIFSLCSWYYLSMFCAIYKKTQYHLIINTLISFGLSLIYSLIIYLLPGAFRIAALSSSKKNKICLYSFSQVLQKLCLIH